MPCFCSRTWRIFTAWRLLPGTGGVVARDYARAHQRFDILVALFTNLSRDHLDYHGSMEAYAAAKARLFRWPGLKYAVLNLDDAFGVELSQQLRERIRK